MDKISWLKKNALVIILVLVIIFLLLPKNPQVVSRNLVEAGGGNSISMGIAQPTAKLGLPVMDSFYTGAAPVVSDQRMVVQNTTLSMQVKDVSSVLKSIESISEVEGGYMVNKGESKPEGAASGHISIRVLTEKREEALDKIRALGVKVVNEEVFGNDITDEYVDLETRIANLEKVKAKMNAILDQANQVQDLVQVQTQINSIQSQIDSLKGQQKYMEQTAKLTLITVTLSTDELALPFTPDNAWRPGVVFKTALRSMIGSIRSIANALIWIAVYLPVILIVGVILFFLNKLYKKYSGK